MGQRVSGMLRWAEGKWEDRSGRMEQVSPRTRREGLIEDEPVQAE